MPTIFAVLSVLLMLLPIAYGSALLMTPPKPTARGGSERRYDLRTRRRTHLDTRRPGYRRPLLPSSPRYH
jgi:hypothetical protein